MHPSPISSPFQAFSDSNLDGIEVLQATNRTCVVARFFGLESHYVQAHLDEYWQHIIIFSLQLYQDNQQKRGQLADVNRYEYKYARVLEESPVSARTRISTFGSCRVLSSPWRA
jgi:hypothetical protein